MALNEYERKLSFPNQAAVLKYALRDEGNLRNFYVRMAGATSDIRNKNISNKSTDFYVKEEAIVSRKLIKYFGLETSEKELWELSIDGITIQTQVFGKRMIFDRQTSKRMKYFCAFNLVLHSGGRNED